MSYLSESPDPTHREAFGLTFSLLYDMLNFQTTFAFFTCVGLRLVRQLPTINVIRDYGIIDNIGRIHDGMSRADQTGNKQTNR